MAGVNKNFIVKNGLEVNNGLIFTDVANSVVGVGTTALNPAYKFQVAGGIGATSLTVTGITTTTSAVITSSATINSAVVGSAVTINSSGINVTGNIKVSGIVTASSYQVGTTTVFNTTDGLLSLSGIQTFDTTTKSTFETLLSSTPNQFDDLSVTGISTLGGVEISSGIVTAVSGIVTYYGDGTNLTGVSAFPAGTINNVQYNNGSVTAGSNNFVFTGTHVGIGTTNPTAAADPTNTSILNVGIVTANSYYGTLIGDINSTGISTFATLKVGTAVTISGGIVTANSYYGDGSNLTNTGPQIQAGLGTVYLALTSLTSGILTSVSIDQTTLQWNYNNNTLYTTNIDLTDNLYVGTASSLGIATAQSLFVSGITTLGVTSTTNFTAQQLDVSGISTLGVTSTTNFTAQSLIVSGISTLGVTTVSQLNVSGVTTTNSVSIGVTQVISSARQLQNIASLDATTTATIESAIANAPNTFSDLNVTGLSTFSGITTHTTSLFGTQASFTGSVTASSFSGSLSASNISGSISDTQLSTISTANKVSISALNISGGTAVTALTTDDLLIIDDGANGTNRKITANNAKSYFDTGVTSSAITTDNTSSSNYVYFGTNLSGNNALRASNRLIWNPIQSTLTVGVSTVPGFVQGIDGLIAVGKTTNLYSNGGGNVTLQGNPTGLGAFYVKPVGSQDLLLQSEGIVIIGNKNGSTQALFYTGSGGYTLLPQSLGITNDCQVGGNLSKGSGSFKIDHPLESKKDTHYLVHSFIEGPQADLIYRGKIQLMNGIAIMNIDSAANMTEGTFEVLCRDVQCFTTNETGWTPIRGNVVGNILTIEAQDNTCTDTISWMVVGERQDPHMYKTSLTDQNGRVITEPLKSEDEYVNMKPR
jgi:hypothetical protein